MTLFDDRLALARRVARQLLDDYGDRIVAIGLHGSMAHRAIDERSDLDFAILTRHVDDLEGRDLIYDGVLLSLSTHGVDDYLEEAGRVDDAWAIESDAYATAIALFDPDRVFDRACERQEQAAREAEPVGFTDRARENVVGARESLGKAQRCLEHHSVVAAHVCLTESVISLAQAIGLLTRTRWRGRHTAVGAASDVGAFVEGFGSAYGAATDPSLDIALRLAAAGVACRACEAHLETLGVTSHMDSLSLLLG